MPNLLVIQNKDDNTPLHVANTDKTKVFCEALGDCEPEIFAKILAMQNINGNTLIHLVDANKFKAFAKVLGDMAPETFTKVLAIQNKNGNTPLHLAGPYKVEALAEVLGENTDEIFGKILPIENNRGELAICPSESICNFKKFVTFTEVAPSSTKKALKEKYGSKTYKDVWLQEFKHLYDDETDLMQDPRSASIYKMIREERYNSWKKFLDEFTE